MVAARAAALQIAATTGGRQALGPAVAAAGSNPHLEHLDSAASRPANARFMAGPSVSTGPSIGRRSQA